jgi:hypothetical protein
MSMGLIQDWILPAPIGDERDKVMAGGTPANPATLVGRRKKKKVLHLTAEDPQKGGRAIENLDSHPIN